MGTNEPSIHIWPMVRRRLQAKASMAMPIERVANLPLGSRSGSKSALNHCGTAPRWRGPGTVRHLLGVHVQVGSPVLQGNLRREQQLAMPIHGAFGPLHDPLAVIGGLLDLHGLVDYQQADPLASSRRVPCPSLKTCSRQTRTLFLCGFHLKMKRTYSTATRTSRYFSARGPNSSRTFLAIFECCRFFFPMPKKSV